MRKLREISIPDEIVKLPKWAQQHIESLTRQRETAVRELNEYIDNQTPSKFYSDNLVCTGEVKSGGPISKRQYHQCYTMTIEHAGIQLRVTAFDEKEISLQYGSVEYSGGDVLLIPTSYNCLKLKHPKNAW
jgi:hypothetical protein